MDLSIITVAFRNKEKLKITLDHVFASKTNFEYEVIVVDNDSQDGTAEMVERDYSQVKLIHAKNEGFSKGNNIGYAKSSGRIVLALNPDTAVEPDVFEECIKFLDSRPDVGILGCKVVKEDGSIDLASRRSIPDLANAFFRFTRLSFLFPKNKTLANYNLTNTDADQEMEVGSVSGAFLMIKREIIEKIGFFFDEDYQMYGEDIDTCMRCKELGYKVWYYPKVTTVHYKGQSSRKMAFRALYWFHKSMWIFYKKHYDRKKYPFFVGFIVWLGVWSRFSALYLLNKLRSEPYVSK